MSSSPGISRPRPVSMLNRQSRRSLGAVPETLQKSLSAAARRMSTTSMPASPLPAADTAEPAASSDSHQQQQQHQHQWQQQQHQQQQQRQQQQQQQYTARVGDAWPTECDQGSSPKLSERGLNPEPSASPPSSVTTAPLSPVFSAVSSEPLKPQPLASANSCKQPAKGGPAPTHTTTATTSNPSLGGPAFFGDKYAALADLDSAFHNPHHTPSPTTTTAINWCPSHSAQEEEPAHPHPPTTTTPVTTPTTIPIPSPTTKNPTPSRPTTLQSPTEPCPITGDKYAALVNLNSTSDLDTVVDWDKTIEFKTEHASEIEGPSRSVCASGAALGTKYGEKPQTNCCVEENGSRSMAESVRVAGNTNKRISYSTQRRSRTSSSSSTSPSSPSSAPTQMYGSPPPQSPILYAAQIPVNSVQRPTTLYNAPFATPHPGFVVPNTPVSPNSGYVFPQRSYQHGAQVTSPVGGSWVPAYAAGAAGGVGSQGFPVPQGAGWGQVGGVLPSPSSSSSHPFVMGASFPGQASMCLS